MTTVDLTKSGPNGAATVATEPARVPLAEGQIRYYVPAPAVAGIYSPGAVVLLSIDRNRDGWWYVFHIGSGIERTQPIDDTCAYEPADLGAVVRRMATGALNNSTHLKRMLNDARDTHEQFRAHVRELAIETKHEQEWCLEGLNKGLRALGLDEYMPSHEVRVSITVYATVEAESADAARDRLREYAESLIDGNTDDDVTDISTSEYGS